MARTIRVTGESAAGVEVSEGSVKAYSANENLIYVDSTGVYIAGNMSILTEPNNIRISSLFKFPTAYQMMLPSTTVSPQPQLIPSAGVEGFASLAADVARFLSELIPV